MGWLRNWRRRRHLEHATLPAEAWAAALRLPVFDGLSLAEQQRLQQLATLFLHEKVIEPVQGARLDPDQRVMLAAHAALPILGLDMDWYEGWQTILIYPDEFVTRQEHLDDDGVMHVWREARAGESWERGPVILSWADVAASGQCDGYNVVIHELAHKLDLLRGDEANGFPPLHRDMSAHEWTATFGAAYADLTRRVEAGEETAIDPYAITEPAEFFAVTSEYFFELPGVLLTEYPTIYEQLRRFYRKDPHARFAAVDCATSEHVR